jgi:hydrogenase-4 component B
MTESLLVFSAFLLPLAGIVSFSLIPHFIRAKANLVFVLLTGTVTSVFAIKALTGSSIEILINNTPVFGNISIHIDSLSAWFILIVNLTCINGAFYGIGYMRQYDEQTTNLCLHWRLFLLFQASMLWVCTVQNGLAFLIVWELMSISSFLLVIFEHKNKTTLRAGINYFIQMHIGVLFLTAAFVWLYFSVGSFEFIAIEKFFSVNPNTLLFLLFFTGFGIKAGFIPLHSWLPQAHPAAPSHISAVMSGVIVKLGIYGILRVAFFLRRDYTVIGEIIIILSVLTGLYGILNAAVHRDYKKMLAYCTIENIGIIGIGIGLGLLGMGNGNNLLIAFGFVGALLHTLNHSLFKSLLFFTAGSLYQQTHTRDMEKLGGLIKQMPQTALLFLLGALAIGGLPPFNGFVSEFLLYSGILIGIKSFGVTYISLMIFSLTGLVLIGGISMLSFTKAFGTIFLGIPRNHLEHQPREVAWGMRLPQYFILIIMLSISMFPRFYISAVNEIVSKMIFTTGSLSIPPLSAYNISTIGKFSILFILLAILIYFIRKILTYKRPITEDPTWSCGYSRPSSKMQYTGKSFSKSLGKLLNFVVLEKKKYKEITPNEIFPAQRRYSSHYNDFFSSRIFDWIVGRLLYSLNYFQFIQNGKIQLYILYGVLFIVAVFLGTMFNLI